VGNALLSNPLRHYTFAQAKTTSINAAFLFTDAIYQDMRPPKRQGALSSVAWLGARLRLGARVA
jgi:hypothetical protein